MENSIENVWKKGFLEGQALVAPKVNNLYNQKSVHITEKYMRMFRNNIWGIIIGATILLIGSYFIGAFIAGSVLFITLMAVAYSAKNDMESLTKLDKGQSSYEYLSAFRDWIEDSIVKYGSLYRIVYPILILCFYFGLWFSDIFGDVRQTITENSEYLFFGTHLHITMVMLSGSVIMSVLAKRIHREDVRSLYGGIMKKLDETLAEMEELRTSN